MRVYGIDDFEEIEASQKDPESQGDSKAIIAKKQPEIVHMLSDFLIHENAELRSIVVEGFCRLIYNSQLSDPKVSIKSGIFIYHITQILSRLIVLYSLYGATPNETTPIEAKKPKGGLYRKQHF